MFYSFGYDVEDKYVELYEIEEYEEWNNFSCFK